MAPRTALVAVDVQGTFADDVPAAGLPVPGSGERVEAIRRFTVAAARAPATVMVVTSQDWHPAHLPEHMVEHDGDTPDFARGVFTRHGLAGTPEAELHPRFATPELLAAVTARVRKGQRSAAFSAFEGRDDGGRPLLELLRAASVERLVVYGFELANCVSATALDASAHGFETVVVPELCSVLDPDRLPETLARLEAAGVRVLDAAGALALLGEEAEEEHLERHPGTERGRSPRAEHTVDIALFTIHQGALAVLLVRRGQRPEKGRWALPGGVVDLGAGGAYGEGEGLDEAAQRELLEETGLAVFPGYLEQLRTYGDPRRDRRGRVFSTAYVGMMPNLPVPLAGDDVADAHFVPVDGLGRAGGPALAFDHDRIVADALERVRGKIEYEGRLAASFLTEPFTIADLRRVYEIVWGGPVHKADFRRNVLSAGGFLVPAGDAPAEPGGSPAQLYRLGPATRLHPPMPRDLTLLAARDDASDADEE